MGVTKQAAQKRFVAKGDAPALDPSQGFSRFNDRARAVVVAAQEEARTARNETIGVAHLVLALVADPGSTAARAIEAQGVSRPTCGGPRPRPCPRPRTRCPRWCPSTRTPAARSN